MHVTIKLYISLLGLPNITGFSNSCLACFAGLDFKHYSEILGPAEQGLDRACLFVLISNDVKTL